MIYFILGSEKPSKIKRKKEKKKKNTTTKNRARTHEEQVKAKFIKYPILPHCGLDNVNCQQRCHSVIDEEDRKRIHRNFWSSDFHGQMMFFNDHIGLLSSRSRYSLTSQKNGRQNVCLEMFKRTLGLKSYKRISNFLKRRKNKPNTFTIDHRGKHTPSKKLNNTPIIAHIESYKPEQSHDRKEYALHLRYLPSELTITDMYKDYKSRVGEGAAPTYNTYRRIFKERKKLS